MKLPVYQMKPALRQKPAFSPAHAQSLEFLKLSHQEIRQELLALLKPHRGVHFSNENLLKIYAGQAGTSVRADLYYQLHTCRQSYDPEVCGYIIESLDAHGFFAYHQEQPFPYPQVKVDQALKLIQSLEPEGIATENSTDFLTFQLRKRKQELPCLILTRHAQDVIDGRWDSIREALSITAKQLDEALKEIRSCRLTPCEMEEPASEWIHPDVIVSIEHNTLTVTPTISELPEFPISPEKLSREALEYLKRNNLIIDMINQRNLTLLQVFHALAEIQSGFFLNDEPLKPCTLEKVAVYCGIHPSTISRCCRSKVYEFKGQLYSFSTLMAHGNLQGKSHAEVALILRQLLAQEAPGHPLSDDQLVIRLEAEGIQISRRGIANLRRKWNIPNSFQRRKNNLGPKPH